MTHGGIFYSVMDSHLKKRALIKVGYRCNNNCVFCHSAPHRGFDLSPSQLIQRLEMAASLGARSIVLSGGEPTIRPDLIDAARWCNRHGLGFGLVTNGRMLVYDKLRKQLLENGLEYVYLSLSGADQASHDWHTRSNSFDQFCKLAPLLAQTVDDFTVNFVITAKNLPSLHEIVPLFKGLSLTDIRLKFSLLEPEGNALDNYEQLVPSLYEASEKVWEVIEILNRSLPSLKTAVDGFPLCVPGEIDHLEHGLREDGFFAMAEAFEQKFFPVDDSNRTHSPKCTGCSLAKRCKGVYKTYLEHSGDHELKPVGTSVSNSFDLIEVSPPLFFDEDSCQVLSGEYPPADPVRELFVRKDEQVLIRYYADSKDFSDKTIGITLQRRQQVYLFEEDSPAPEDFARQLLRLTKSPTCKVCPKTHDCGGIYRRSEEDGFKIFSKYLYGVLSRLRGKVLDIGCGYAPYMRSLEPLIKAGSLQYVGLDPGPLLDRLPGEGKEFFNCSFESFEPPTEPFDSIISLRSLNHLDHPVRAMSKMKDMLGPSGMIVVAEDVVFSLVRPRAKLEKARLSHELEFEHKFNLDLDELCAMAEETGLVLRKKLSCTETKTPVWLAILEKK